MNSYRLDGRHAIVTGGAGGFGRAIAAQMLASGASVSLWDASGEALRSAESELADATPGRVACRVVDVTDAQSIGQALAADSAAFGRIDVLVNNAGVLGATAPIWEADPADVRRVLEVNFMGAFLCLRAVLPAMRAQEARPHRGHVVNVASVQGKEGMPFSAAYSASKAALIALTKSAGKELAGDAIYVNCVTPAAAETAMAKLISAERRAEILSKIPMGRFVEVDEVARMIAWLASDDCSFTTGAIFDLSGGRATY